MTLTAKWPGGWAPSLCPGCGAAIAYFRCRCPPVMANAEAPPLQVAPLVAEPVDVVLGRLAVALGVRPITDRDEH